jgi:excisionase family DNA binding protein
MDETSDLLTIEQAARFLNVSETSLRRWTNDGRLACIRIGRKNIRRFRREDLLAFLRVQPAMPDSTHNHRNGGSTVIGGIPVAHGTHYCSLYSSDAGRAKLAIDFLADGLQQNCACYLISTPTGSRDVLNALHQHRPHFQKDIDAGRLVISEYAESGSLQIKKLEASFKTSLSKGATAIRLVGNISDGHMALTNSFDHVLQYERDYTQHLAKRFPLVTLCQYDTRRHSGTDIMNVMKCHHDGFSYPPERLLF